MKKVYEWIFELWIVILQIVVNYVNLLEEYKYYEEFFKIYERGLDFFSYLVVFEFWNLYLIKVVDWKIGIECLCDFFEQVVEDCFVCFVKMIYFMYGNLEEECGLVCYVMCIYERVMCVVVDED